MDYVNYYNTLGYKQCACRDCNKKGTNKLKILFINRIGNFCDSCTIQLVELGIVTKGEE